MHQMLVLLIPQMNSIELGTDCELIDKTDDRVIYLTFSTQLRFDNLIDAIIKLVRLIEIFEKRRIDSLNVVLTDDKELTRLNSTFRKLNQPTDVLTFDLSDEYDKNKLTGGNTISPNGITGEIYISADRLIAQSAERSVSSENEFLRLLAHGLLHLCGWKHEDDVSLSKIIKTGENYIKMVYHGG